MSPSNSPWSEFRRGWRPLGAALVGKVFSFGTIPIYLVGVFTIPLGEAFGWSRVEVALSYTIATMTAASLAPLIGWLCDRYGARPLVIWGTVGYGLGMAIIGTSGDRLLLYYVSWSLATVLGMGASSIALTRFVAGWFERKRGLALGILLSGSGVAALILPPFVATLIESFDWRAGYFGLSALIFLVGVPVLYLGFKDEPRKQPERPFSEHKAPARADQVKPISGFRLAVRSRTFWIMAVAFCCATFGFSGLVSSFAPILEDAGYARSQAAALSGLIGLFIVVGRVGAGYLLDYLWAPGLTFVALTIGAAACGLLGLPALPVWMVVCAAFCLGVSAGAKFAALPFMIAREFDLASYGRVYSLIMICQAFVTASGPPIFGLTFDLQGSYLPVLLLSMALLVFGPALLLLLRRGKGDARAVESQPKAPATQGLRPESV